MATAIIIQANDKQHERARPTKKKKDKRKEKKRQEVLKNQANE